MTSYSHHPRPTERGSVFLYILIAVALLAWLSYAVSRNNRGSTSLMTEQQAKLAAQEIVEYGNTLAAAVQKLKLRGCTDTQISFENSVGTDNYSNPNAPTDKSCHVFDQAGANIIYTKPSDILLDTSKSAGAVYGQLNFNSGYQYENVGTIENDLAFKINWIRREVCISINNILSVTNPSDEPPVENNDSASIHFKGVYGTTVSDTIGDDGTGLDGKTAFCRYASANDSYQYNQILLAR